MIVWFGLLSNKLIGPSVFDINLTGNTYEFLSNELTGRHPINGKGSDVLQT